MYDNNNTVVQKYILPKIECLYEACLNMIKNGARKGLLDV